MSSSSGEGRQAGPLALLGRRVVRFGAIYSVGTVVSFAILITQVAVLTRLMPPSDFGRFAILLIFSGFVTLLCNLGVVQGTLVSAFQGADEEGDVPDEAELRKVGDNRRILGTGVTVVLLIAALVTATSAAAARPLSFILLGGEPDEAAVVLATGYGTLGAVWRLVSAIPRFERRPVVYVLINVLRGVLVVGGAVALVGAGYGVAGAFAGLALGKAVALAAAIAVSRHRFRFALDRGDAWRVTRRGAPFVGISLSFFVARNVDLYILSRYVSDAYVAFYRVGGRLGSASSLALNLTIMAWGPLVRGPIAVALKERGAMDVARARVVTYFFFLATGVIVTLVLWADVLVGIASSDYSEAAVVIPLLGIAGATQGTLFLLYYMGRMEGKMRLLRRVAVASAPLMIVLSLVLVPAYGIYGACAASIIVPAIGATVMFIRAQGSEHPLLFPWSRLGRGLAIAMACIVGGLAARRLEPAAETGVDALLVAAYPVLLILTGALPMAEVRRLLSFLAPWQRRIERRQLRQRLGRLEQPEREMLESLAVHREQTQQVARRLETSDDALLKRFVGVLRKVADAGPPGAADDRIGAHLLSGGSPTRRDIDGHMLSLNRDVVPLELARLTDIVERMRTMPRSRRGRPRIAPIKPAAVVAALGLAVGGAVLAGAVIDPGAEDAGVLGSDTRADGRQGGAGRDGLRPDAPHAVGGLSVAHGGYSLEVGRTFFAAGQPARFTLRITDARGRVVRGGFNPEQERELHLVVMRRDTAIFEHLHPRRGPDGTWTTQVTLREPGVYRAYADFQIDGRRHTLATDLFAPGDFGPNRLPAPVTTARAGGYDVALASDDLRAGAQSALRFAITRDGRPAPNLEGNGHLVVVREGDLAYLHVRPVSEDQLSGVWGPWSNELAFAAPFPTAGRYRLFLQFKADGAIRTVAYTLRVPP